MTDSRPSDGSGALDGVLDEALAAAFGGAGAGAPAPRGAAARVPTAAAFGETVPKTLGPYRIEGLLGAGGMGIVYEAVEEHPERRIALKVIRPHVASAAAAARFEREAALLARLQHAGIARVYAAGALDVDGADVAFLAMERVHGAPLDDWVEAHDPPRRVRLELVARLADAVQHAHQRGVIHRDIKPGNVLVDGEGQPKLVDFGIARAVDADAATHATMAGQVLGTLPYMAPEQLRGETDAIDARADVYALGAVLFFLLTGETPYDLAGLSPASAALEVAQAEPRRVARIDASLRGDLDAITSCALAADPERRYASAAALADDIRRHLVHEPVAARPATALYQLTRVVRRHRATTAAALVALSAVTGGGYWSSARLARKNAEIALARAEAEGINDFILEEILFSARPDRSLGESLTVREAVDRAAGRVGEADITPAVEASVREALGETLFKLGAFEESARELRHALARARAARGADDERTLRAQERLARVLGELGPEERDASWVLAEDLVERRARLFGPNDPGTMRARFIVAGHLRDAGRLEEAGAEFRELAALREARFGRVSEPTLYALSSAADCLSLAGDFEAALDLRLETNAITAELLSPLHPETIYGLNNLGNCYADLGRVEEAEAAYRLALERTDEVFGPDHIERSSPLNNLSVLLQQNGRNGGAGPLARESLALRRAAWGEDHRRTLVAQHNLGVLLAALDRPQEAMEQIRAAHDRRLETLGPGHPDTLYSRAALARAMLGMGDAAGAEAIAREAVEGAARAESDRHWVLDRLIVTRARALAELGHGDEARALATSARARLRERLGDGHRFVVEAEEVLELLAAEAGLKDPR